MVKLAMLTGDMGFMGLLMKHSTLENLDNDGNSALHIALKLWLTDRSQWNIVELILSLEHADASLLFARVFAWIFDYNFIYSSQLGNIDLLTRYSKYSIRLSWTRSIFCDDKKCEVMKQEAVQK